MNHEARKAHWRAARKRNAAEAVAIGMCVWCWNNPGELMPDGSRRLGCAACYVQRAQAASRRRKAQALVGVENRVDPARESAP